MESVTTDNTSYASLLASSAYDAGGTFFWRVAALDADSNLGDFTAARTFTLPAMAVVLKKFQLSSSGYPIKGRFRTITINVKDTAGVPVSFASVRVSGAGVPAASKYTNTSGVAKFSVKATRYPGTVTFRITKNGFQTAYLYKRVRRS
jgi:hypothetical protein